jgi:PAS domain S-box-containing protein
VKTEIRGFIGNLLHRWLATSVEEERLSDALVVATLLPQTVVIHGIIFGRSGHMTESAAALVFAEPSGVIRIWNSTAESLFGHRAAEAIGQTLDLIVPPDYRGRHWEGYRAAMAAADALHRDGTIIRVEVRLLVIHDSRNRVAGALAVFVPADESARPLPRL